MCEKCGMAVYIYRRRQSGCLCDLRIDLGRRKRNGLIVACGVRGCQNAVYVSPADFKNRRCACEQHRGMRAHAP
jgi:hypothetical protein